MFTKAIAALATCFAVGFESTLSFPLMLKVLVTSLSVCHKLSFRLLLLQGIADHIDAQLADHESSKRSSCCLLQAIAGLQVDAT